LSSYLSRGKWRLLIFQPIDKYGQGRGTLAFFVHEILAGNAGKLSGIFFMIGNRCR
jgi:hypothetical protein